VSGFPDSAASTLYIGLMSGTSLDGVDAALVDLARSPALLNTEFLPYPEMLKVALLDLHTAGQDELHRAALLGIELAQLYATVVNRLLEKSKTHAASIRAIGCHGQTVRHRPGSGYTLQLCNAALLAERTGIAVVNDFRSRDIAAGGQGAPLVPAFHAACFRDLKRHRVIANIGGIANLTDLPINGTVTGFDTGPGNLLLDAWAKEKLGADFDAQGNFAAHGQPVEELLSRMLADPYFASAPPKSTGRDHFNSAWLNAFGVAQYKAEDIQATLAELTARSLSDAILRHCTGADEIYLCGGGAHNDDLLSRLRRLLPACGIATTAALGLSPDWVEATAFAWLARCALEGLPGNLAEVTGASGPRVLGAIYPA